MALGEYGLKPIRDNIHGDINFTQLEIDIINTRSFQRLKNLHQLTTAQVIYHSATHSRFSHSLGVCGIAKDIIRSINSKSHDGARIDRDTAQIISLAALLHDILNLSFGHLIEDEYPILGSETKHDDPELLTDFLTNVQQEPIARILSNYYKESHRGIAHEIGKLIAAGTDEEIKKLKPKNPFGADIISNTICADLLDYLARDIQQTGLYDSYDYDRILSSFDIYQNRLVLRLHREKTIRRSVLSEILKLMQIRYRLAERIYYNSTKICASAMIGRAIAEGIKAGLITISNLREIGDQELLFVLERGYKISHDNIKIDTSHADIAKYIIANYKRRNLFRSAWDLHVDEANAIGKKTFFIEACHKNIDNHIEYENEIADFCKVPRGGVLIYCPWKMSRKEAEASVLWPDGGEGKLMKFSKVPDFIVKTDLDALYQKHESLWTMYVLLDEDYKDLSRKVHSTCYEVFDLDPAITRELKELRLRRSIDKRGKGAITSQILLQAAKNWPESENQINDLINEVEQMSLELDNGDEK